MTAQSVSNSNKDSDGALSPFIYLSGIGGTGMSALAGILKFGGIQVQGSDAKESIITQRLRNLGIKVFTPQKAENLKKLNQPPHLVIRSPAVLNTVPEIKEFIKHKIPIIAYHQGLGLITPSFKTIGIAGTHGKTSTTAILSKILLTANVPFLGLVGALYKEFNNTNFYIHPQLKIDFKKIFSRLELVDPLPPVDKPISEFARFPTLSYSNFFVIEADEYKQAILNHNFYILALVGIDYDHTDYYKTQDAYLEVFAKAILNTRKYVIMNLNSTNQQRILEIAQQLAKKEGKVLPKIINWAENIHRIKQLALYLKTQFLIDDATVAYTVAKLLKLPERTITRGIESYEGIWRRFEIKYKLFDNKTTVISDYAHNPQKIRYALQALITYMQTHNNASAVVIFQAHQYYRLYSLKDEFIKTFTDFLSKTSTYKLDIQLWITDIYDARSPEEHKKLINAHRFTNELKNRVQPEFTGKVIYTRDLDHTKKMLNNLNNHAPDIVFLLSAGDLEKILPDKGKGK